MMAHLSSSPTSLLLYFILAVLLLNVSAAPSEPNTVSNRLDRTISSRESGGPPPGTKNPTKTPNQSRGPQKPWSKEEENEVDSGDAPEDVGENDVDVEPAEVPRKKAEKMKKRPSADKPNTCNCAGECCKEEKDEICTLMIGQLHMEKFTTCCLAGQHADWYGNCCQLRYLDPHLKDGKNAKPTCCAKKCRTNWTRYWNTHPSSF